MVEPSAEGFFDAQDRALARVLGVVGELDGSQPVHGSAWTVHDLLAHLVATAERYRSFDAGSMAADPREVDALNEVDIAHLADRSLERLRTDLADAHRRLQQAAEERPATARLPFHAGLTISAAGAAGEWLGELLIHGHDLARTARRPWPIDARDALAVADFTFEVMPAYFDGAAVSGPLDVEVRLRGGGRRLLSYRDGLSVTDGGTDRADVVIATTPQAWVLLGYGRISLLGAIRRGLLVVGGRRPWRALELLRASVAP